VYDMEMEIEMDVYRWRFFFPWIGTNAVHCYHEAWMCLYIYMYGYRYRRAGCNGMKDGVIVVHLQAMQHARKRITSLSLSLYRYYFQDAMLCIAHKRKVHARYILLLPSLATKTNHCRFLSTFLALLSTSSPYPLLATKLHKHHR
jgi:hypothetical protein